MRAFCAAMLGWAAAQVAGCSGADTRPAVSHQAIPSTAILPDGGAAVEGDAGTEPGVPGDARPESVLIEARGVWVTRWDFNSASDIETIMRDAAAAGFNQVYFQVRGIADAYYRSTREPWAGRLTGKLGQDPLWDPLAVAVSAAHEHGIELHAWINVAAAWSGKLPPGPSTPAHLLRVHPDWRVVLRAGAVAPEGDYVFVNPILPGFQDHIEAVIAEIALGYDVDGVHLDYCRFPAAGSSHDREANRLYREAKKKQPGLDRADWQRAGLTRLVQRIAARVHALKPTLEVSAAVTGIYQDRWGWGDVKQGFHDFFQDSHRWAREKSVDALIPMIYWPPTDPAGERTDFTTLVEDFQPVQEHVRLLVGINVTAGDLSVLEREIGIARDHGCAGVVLFSWTWLKDKDLLTGLRQGVFAQKALPVKRGQSR